MPQQNHIRYGAVVAIRFSIRMVYRGTVPSTLGCGVLRHAVSAIRLGAIRRYVAGAAMYCRVSNEHVESFDRRLFADLPTDEPHRLTDAWRLTSEQRVASSSVETRSCILCCTCCRWLSVMIRLSSKALHCAQNLPQSDSRKDKVSAGRVPDKYGIIYIINLYKTSINSNDGASLLLSSRPFSAHSSVIKRPSSSISLYQ